MMKNLIKMEAKNENEKLDLLENHIFQFDFLNDDFSKLPDNLQRIIKNEPEKLVIFINPPYAEATSATTPTGTGKNKALVARENKICEKYKEILGKANNELFAQFFIRIYKEIPNCILATFSTLKYINASSFSKFRQSFYAKFLKGFICPAFTFDNVQGKFPIGFLVWDTQSKTKLFKVPLDLFDEKNKKEKRKKVFYNLNGHSKSINKWLREFTDNRGDYIALLDSRGTDFQNQQYIFIKSQDLKITAHSIGFYITKNNLIPAFVYFAVRKTIRQHWTNNRDQFWYPNKKWLKDKEFQNNCFVFTLFNGKNMISIKDGVNNIIPFTEKELNVQEAFESHFLLDFMAGRIKSNNDDFLGKNVQSFIPTKPMEFSIEAQNVLSAAKAIYVYYHQVASDKRNSWKINDQVKYSRNASFYDIKEFFQGRSEKGRMNPKSEDLKYTELLNNLKNAQKILAQKIEPKIYEYEFLLE